MMLVTIFMLCFMGQVLTSKLEYLFDPPKAYCSLALICIFGGLCILPFHVFYLRSRKEMLRVLINIVASPFGIVKFKHFFLADIITSLVQPLKDFGMMICLFTSGAWLNLESSSIDLDHTYLQDTKWLQIYIFIVAFVPFWIRLMQCFRRYYETKLVVNLKNAGKYFTSILVQTGAIFFVLYSKNSDLAFYCFIGINILSTLYSYYWDLYMDWGLLRSNEPGKRYLRSKMLYPVWFYYFAAVSNLVMRLMWIVSIFNSIYPIWFIQSQTNFLILSIVEGLRRAQWALIRIENENVNNFERYRNVL